MALSLMSLETELAENDAIIIPFQYSIIIMNEAFLTRKHRDYQQI